MIVPLLLGLSLWFRSSSDKGYQRVRDGIASVLSDLSESLSGVRVVTGFNRARHNVLYHRNVIGVYRDANDHTAHLAATYGACTEFVGLLGQAMLLLIGGNMVQRRQPHHRRADRLHPLPELVLPADPEARPAVQPVPAGPGRDHQARRAALDAPDRRGGGRRRGAAADRRRRHPRARLVRLRPREAGAPRRRPAHRGGRDHRAGRPDRRGQVDHRQARHPVLRPDARTGARSTVTTCATSPSTRCAVSSASCPRSRSSSRGRCATTSPSPARAPPTTR